MPTYGFTELYEYFIVLVRISGTMLLIPALGESFISTRFRAMIALTLTIVITPLASQYLPPDPGSVFGLLHIVVRELFVGLLIGAIGRLMIAAIDMAGGILSFQMSLSSAMVFNPAMGGQGSILSAFLTLSALLIIFALDLHHLMIKGLIASYQLIGKSTPILMQDIAGFVTKTVSRMFLVGVQIASPILIVGILAQLMAGFLNRLMPQLQIYFITMPVYIAAGFVVLLASVGVMLEVFADAFADQYKTLFLGGP